MKGFREQSSTGTWKENRKEDEYQTHKTKPAITLFQNSSIIHQNQLNSIIS